MIEFSKQIEKNGYTVKIEARESDEVLGWTFLHILPNARHKESYAYLENVYVEQEHRSKGLGTKLVEAAIAAAREHGCYKLIGTSRYSKPEVHKFYEKFGFKDWGKEFRLDLIDSKPIQRD